MDSPVECAIARMWESYSEPLSLTDIAKSAILSRFHFSRVFRGATGVSPGRFLSAVRIYQAKRMLVSTSLSVTDISLAVGYNSLGSFTNRFTESVGVSPTRFRRLWGDGGLELPGPVPDRSAQLGAVAGTIGLPSGYAAARVYIGAFKTPIIQCQPLSRAIVQAEPGPAAPYQLAGVLPGNWFIRAVAVADSADPEPWTRRSLLIGGQGSVTVAAGAVSETDVTLRPRCPTDLPILYAVPDLDLGGMPGRPGAEPASQPGLSPVAARALSSPAAASSRSWAGHHDRGIPAAIRPAS
jgi:AraC family transcriptional regulator